MGNSIPEGKKVCSRCGGSGTETETYQEKAGGASNEMITKQRQITCKACHGQKYY